MSEEIKALTTEVEAFIAKSNEEVERHGSMGIKNSEGLKALEDKVAEQTEAMADMEQKLASADKRVADHKAASMSLGQSVVAHDKFADFQNSGSRTTFEVQANTVGSDSASGTSLTSVGTAADRLPGVFAAFQPISVLDVISKGVTSSNLVEFAQESGTNTNNAAAAAEAGALGESVMNFALKQTPVQMIGTFVKISRQCRDDAPQLASFIDNRLAYYVNRKLENQIINGDGTSPNLEGILSSGSTDMTDGSGGIINDLRDMLQTLQTNGFNASAFFLNPADLATIDKTVDSAGAYIAADPRANNLPVIWGVPVVTSDQVAAGKGIVGDWAAASALHVRQGTVVEMFEQDGTNVQSNLITVRASVRAAYCTYNTLGVIRSDIA